MWTIMHLADIHLDDRREAGERPLSLAQAMTNHREYS